MDLLNNKVETVFTTNSKHMTQAANSAYDMESMGIGRQVILMYMGESFMSSSVQLLSRERQQEG